MSDVILKPEETQPVASITTHWRYSYSTQDSEYEYMVVKMAEGFCWATAFQILKEQCEDLTVQAEYEAGFFQYMFRFQDIDRLDNRMIDQSLMYDLPAKMKTLVFF